LKVYKVATHQDRPEEAVAAMPKLLPLSSWGQNVLRIFAIGVVMGVLLVIGGTYYYFVSGMAPVATADRPLPYEKKIASKSKNAHMRKQTMPPSPVAPDEPNLIAGAKVYKEQCASCHGLPSQPAPAISEGMYPHSPLLFKGKGVTDDPPGETHWTVENGIRLTGMPSFKNTLTDTQLWQVTQLLANADKISDSVKGVLAPAPEMGMPAGMHTSTMAPSSK
jgi:mono/diheme cytochrome c family protein